MSKQKISFQHQSLIIYKIVRYRYVLNNIEQICFCEDIDFNYFFEGKKNNDINKSRNIQINCM